MSWSETKEGHIAEALQQAGEKLRRRGRNRPGFSSVQRIDTTALRVLEELSRIALDKPFVESPMFPKKTIALLGGWYEERATESKAVHFCSEDCQDKYNEVVCR